jgi:phosphoribosyl 1,2-cyclic phosphate phosphodiesterase
VVNALRKKEHISHFNLEEALAFIAELAPERAFLTHISHLMGRHAEVELPPNVHLAYDGLTVDL